MEGTHQYLRAFLESMTRRDPVVEGHSPAERSAKEAVSAGDAAALSALIKSGLNVAAIKDGDGSGLLELAVLEVGYAAPWLDVKRPASARVVPAAVGALAPPAADAARPRRPQAQLVGEARTAEVCRVLIEEGAADVDQLSQWRVPSAFASRDRHVSSPLLAAAESGHAALVKLLLEAGTNPHVTNELGNTPLRQAERGVREPPPQPMRDSDYAECVRLLRAACAATPLLSRAAKREEGCGGCGRSEGLKRCSRWGHEKCCC